MLYNIEEIYLQTKAICRTFLEILRSLQIWSPWRTI